MQAFGEAYEKGDETTIPITTFGIPPYGPDITHVERDVYFIAWSEGDAAPMSAAKGRFVRISTP